MNFLPSRHWYHFFSTDGGLETYFSFPFLYCWSKGQPYQVLQTSPLSCIFRSILPYPFIVSDTNLSCTVAGKGYPSQIGSFYFFCSSHLIDPRLSISSKPHNLTYLFFLPTQVPHVHDIQNPSIAKHHTLYHSIANPTKYITEAQYLISFQCLRGLKLLISDFLKKEFSAPHFFPAFNTLIFTVEKPSGTYHLV